MMTAQGVVILAFFFISGFITPSANGQLVGKDKECCYENWNKTILPLFKLIQAGDLSSSEFQSLFKTWNNSFDEYYTPGGEPEGICKGFLTYQCVDKKCVCADGAVAEGDLCGFTSEGHFCDTVKLVHCKTGFNCTRDGDSPFERCVKDPNHPSHKNSSQEIGINLFLLIWGQMVVVGLVISSGFIVAFA